VESLEPRLRALMVEAQSGDAKAYAALLEMLGGHLRAFFRRRLGREPDSVEDLVQETLLAVHNHRDTYDQLGPFTAWVHAIAKYKLIDHLRRSGRRVTESLADNAEAFASEADHDASNARRDLGKLLATLPAHFRLPIEAVKLEGLSVQEAAARTGMSVPAIKIGIHRGLKALARRLKGDGDANR
jgi:RNA polymerase sigma-70 factor, ECF subfamily